MYVRKNNQVKSQHQRFWRWDNWKMYAVIIVIPLIFFPLYRFIIKQMQKTSETSAELEVQQQFLANQDPTTQLQNATQITTSASVQAYARELAHQLGTMYEKKDWWQNIFNPRYWTENDKRVADILIYQKNNYQLLAKLYNKVYTRSRNLSNDILELLDEDELKRVKKYVNI